MTKEHVRTVGSTVYSGNSRISFDYPVEQAWWLDNLLIVLLDPDAREEKFGQFPNLLAVDVEGHLVWTAELPTTVTGNRYYGIASQDPIVAYSVSSHDCEIDSRTGKILRRTFAK